MHKLLAREPVYRARDGAAANSEAEASPVVYYLTYIGAGASWGQLVSGVGSNKVDINFSEKPESQPGLELPEDGGAPYYSSGAV